MHMIKKIKTLLVTLVALSLFASVSSAQYVYLKNTEVKTSNNLPSFQGGQAGGGL